MKFREVFLLFLRKICPTCHTTLDRDINANCNILAEGLRLSSQQTGFAYYKSVQLQVWHSYIDSQSKGSFFLEYEMVNSLRFAFFIMRRVVMKRFLAIFLFTIIGCLVPLHAQAEDTFQTDLFRYKIVDGEVEITKYLSNYTIDVVVPKTIDGKPVTRIGDSVFESKSIKSLTLPEGLISIGAKAFYRTTDIGELKLPSTLKEIGEMSFSSAGVTAVTIPKGLTTISFSAFGFNQIKSVTIPSTVREIGRGAFAYNALTDITIEPGVTVIGAKAFEGTKLTTVTIPDTVVSIGELGFGNTPLTTIKLSSALETIEKRAFYKTKLTNVTFPKTIELIGDEAFSETLLENIHFTRSANTTIGKKAFYKTKLTALTLPEGVKEIGSQAFMKVSSLTTISLPQSLKKIGAKAFYELPIEKVTLPKQLTEIGDAAFYKSNLTSIAIPGTLQIMGESAFANNQLNDVTIGEGVPLIAKSAFKNNQIKTITLPDSVTMIGESAFEYNTLTALTLPKHVTAIHARAFKDNLLSTLILPNTLTELGVSAFENNGIESLILPASMPVIPAGAFQRNSIRTLILPSDVKEIGKAAFEGNGLKVVTLPSAVEAIGDDAFQKNDIEQINWNTKLQTIGANAFRKNNLTTVTLPANVQIIKEFAFAQNLIDELALPVSLTAVAPTILGNATTNSETENHFYRSIKEIYTDAAKTKLWDGQQLGVILYVKWHHLARFEHLTYPYIPVNSTFDPLKVIQVEDEEDGDITTRTTVLGTVDTTKIGSYTVHYQVTTSTGYTSVKSRTFYVTRNAKPVISGEAIQTIHLGDKLYVRQNITVSDEEDGDLLQQTRISIPTIKSPGRYEVHYSVTDSNNNTTTFTRVIYVIPSRVQALVVTSNPTSLYMKWADQKGVTAYKVKLYDAKGKLIRTVNTAEADVILDKLPPGTNYRVKVLAYLKLPGKTMLSDYSETISTITAPATSNVMSLKVVNQTSFKATWRKSTTASGYKLQYATSKSFKDGKTVTLRSSKTLAKTINGLKKGQTYYVRVKPYQTFNKKNIFGLWCTAKKVTVK